jgi:hypothetical protein
LPMVKRPFALSTGDHLKLSLPARRIISNDGL